MPRKNYSRYRPPAGPPDLDPDRALRGYQQVESAADGEWSVRRIPAGAAVKTYRCPGCDHEIPPGMSHLVAWPADERGDLSDRRHWHSRCWEGRGRQLSMRRRA